MRAFRYAVPVLALAAASAFAQVPMPQPKTFGTTTYLTGGAGSDEVDYLKSAKGGYTLGVMFSRAGGEYVADVAVTIKDAKGTTVFEAPSVGPYLLVKVPNGTYSVTATYHAESKTKPVGVGGPIKAFTSFQWKS